jgi:hypothetical protein
MVAIAVLQLQLAGQRRFARLGLIIVVHTSFNLALILLLRNLGVNRQTDKQVARKLLK